MAIEDIKKTKEEKIKKLREAGVNPYPAVSSRTHRIADALVKYEELKDKETVRLAGRIIAKREHGGSIFFDINDGTGKIQAYIKEDEVEGGKEIFDKFIELIDIGDFIELTGVLRDTKRKERTIYTASYKLLAKALLPLPEKWHGLQDVEERYRKRYLDFIFNPESKEKIVLRSMTTEHIRQYLLAASFIEVETPTLQTLHGGANAKPFKTHLDTLDLELYLRIAPELYLKRLLVGGFDKVFEIGRVFRNEGMDREHNPEFTMLEFYAAYWDYEKMMAFTEDMIEHILKKQFGKNYLAFEGKEIKFNKPFKRITFNDLFKECSGLDYDVSGESDIFAKAKELGVEVNKAMTKGNVADEIYKKVARPNIVEPTYVINHPIEISPLAKKLDNDDKHVARFQLIVGGMEVVNGFSELNDPVDQRERFMKQEENARKGDYEAQRMDDDFIEALEYGMPPAAGVGIGIDRLVALFTDSHSVREVIAFPLMKPRSDQ